MGRFDKGVKFYTIADLNMQVSFPEDAVCCRYCPFIKHYDSLDRDKCSLTEEILYSKEVTGHKCPLVILNQINSEELES